MNHKAGYVSIIGMPNAGKSTLMNALIGEKLSIITKKPQTTRKKILGFLSEKDYQIIFQDTPGILDPDYLLQERMLESVFSAVEDSDLILFIIDIAIDKTGEKTLSDNNVIKLLKTKIPKVLLLNKVDLSDDKSVELSINSISEKNIFNKIIPISAMLNFNIKQIIETVLEYIPEHPAYYPNDQLSDENERFFVSEIIREKIFELYREEIPYSTEVIIDEFKERENAKDYIRADIVVERESQKPIILGDKGASIKKLGRIAREAVEEFLQRPVYLELFVKVREKWRSNPNFLKSYGYSKLDE